jgi:DsbC/DsbD-like thiol-disulfide interchange protein
LTLPGQKPKDKKLDPVKVEAKGGPIDDMGNQIVTVTITIEKGWHIYANPVGNSELEGSDTVVKVTGKGLKSVVKTNYPKGKEEKSAIGKYKSYENKVAITVTVERAKNDEPLEVSVRYQACDEHNCLLPKTVKLKVP